MNKFQPHIIPVYPPHNELIFEEWFSENYKGCSTDRELMPFFPTSYFVNNGYNEDQQANKEAQDYVDSLPNDKKWFIICQYDNGVIVDWKGKDVLEFNMSKTNGVMLPLLCQPHPYKFKSDKKRVASFVGSRTHPIRNELDKLKGKDGFYISFEPHDIETYCRIMHESIFTLCPRGYGLNSFRIAEALQYGSIPVYISDDFIFPFSHLVTGHWLISGSDKIEELKDNLEEWIANGVDDLVETGMKLYEEFYTYEGCMKQIIKSLETEYNSRQSK
jgi:hypothetical protein